MTDTDRLTSLDAAIRRELLADSFLRSQALLKQYSAELERLLQANGTSPKEVSQLAARTRALFEWMTLVAHSARARLDASLARARRLSRYRVEEPGRSMRGARAW
jgi:hypothetical protein